MAGLFDALSNDFGDELLDEFTEIAGCRFLGHDIEHLLADLTDLRRRGVGGLAELVGATLGEGDSEETEQVAVGSLDIYVSLDNGLPFLKKY